MSDTSNQSIATLSPDDERITRLCKAAQRLGAFEACRLLPDESDDTVVGVLDRLNPSLADQLLWQLPDERRTRVLGAVPAHVREQWIRNHEFPADSIGRLMESPLAVFGPDETVREVIAKLERIVKHAFVTYGWVTDAEGRLLGVLVFRDLLFASPDTRVGEIMVQNPFALRADTPVADAMKDAVKRHFPVYPICNASGQLIGIVRGQTRFEKQAFEISAQPGTMVGVEREERLGTPWPRSLRLRHPWLQLNLVTAFVAAGVVGFYQETIDQLVVLAVFLPVLAGQSGNTGCQAMAVVIRAMTLGDLDKGRASATVAKEAALGLCNGLLVGISAGIAMWLYARSQGNAAAPMLGLVVVLAMSASCVMSGIAGASVPMLLRRMGADPATASSIFVTTATDVASMGTFLGLARVLVL